MITTGSPMYKFMKWLAIALVVLILGMMSYQYLFIGDEPGILHYRQGHQRLEEGHWEQALESFDKHLQAVPEHPGGHFGRALALMQMGQVQPALKAFEQALVYKPDFGAVYANRGILMDRIGRHEAALADYKRALALDETLAKGPGLITRFFRSQWQPPPTIADRAKYLEEELKKPPHERLLRVPELDEKQRPYKVQGNL